MKGRSAKPASRRGRGGRARHADGHAVAIILARAGSKGVPGKNAAMLAGQPCIVWTIDAAIRSSRVAWTVVSTDGAELAAISARAGATVITRPPRLAGDRATVDDAARHALLALEAMLSQRLHDRQPVVILYGNVPIRPAGLLDRAVAMLNETEADSVQSYAPVGKFHPWWTARVNARDGRVTPWEGKVLNHGVFRRQDLPPAFIPDGGVIAVTRQALMLEVPGVTPGPHAFFGVRRHGIVNPEGSVVDIDSPVDLLVAREILVRERGLTTEAPRRRENTERNGDGEGGRGSKKKA